MSHFSVATTNHLEISPEPNIPLISFWRGLPMPLLVIVYIRIVFYISTFVFCVILANAVIGMKRIGKP
jgi:hypothetical protein